MSDTLIEVKITDPFLDIPEERRKEAENKAKEAYVMDLLRHADISAGRAAELLGIDRWTLSDLMSAYDISPLDETLTLDDLKQEVSHYNRIKR